MEKQQPQSDRGLFADDELDKAIANVDDTGMVKSMQEIREGEELERLAETGPDEPQEPLP